LLGSVDPDGTVIVADFEAGLGTLTRLGDVRVDTVIVIVEPMVKSLEVGTRAAAYAATHSTDRVVIVANRIRDDEDLATVRRAFSPTTEIVPVPDDPAIGDADRHGLAPLDAAPSCPAVVALSALAQLVSRS